MLLNNVFVMDKGVIELTGFAPLIQLWAGICLLMFYEKFLEETPFLKIIKKISKVSEKFGMNFQSIIKQKGVEKLEDIYKNDWKCVHKTIKNMAFVSFTYAVILLCFIGIEGIDYYNNTYFYSLEILDFIVAI